MAFQRTVPGGKRGGPRPKATKTKRAANGRRDQVPDPARLVGDRGLGFGFGSLSSLSFFVWYFGSVYAKGCGLSCRLESFAVEGYRPISADELSLTKSRAIPTETRSISDDQRAFGSKLPDHLCTS